MAGSAMVQHISGLPCWLPPVINGQASWKRRGSEDAQVRPDAAGKDLENGHGKWPLYGGLPMKNGDLPSKSGDVNSKLLVYQRVIS